MLFQVAFGALAAGQNLYDAMGRESPLKMWLDAVDQMFVRGRPRGSGECNGVPSESITCSQVSHPPELSVSQCLQFLEQRPSLLPPPSARSEVAAISPGVPQLKQLDRDTWQQPVRIAIEGAAAVLKGGGYDVTTEIAEGQPEKEIADRAEAHDFDLLVMGAYGHSRIRSLLIGSTTTEMIRACKVPVLLFR